MDRRENIVLETGEGEGLIGQPDYEDLIIEMVPQIKNDKFWHFVYDMIIAFKKKWGI